MSLFAMKKKSSQTTAPTAKEAVASAPTPESTGKVKRSKQQKKNAQNFIKFDEFFDNGMMRYGNQYALMFRFENFSFESLSHKEQEDYADKYEQWLNSLPVEDDVFLYIVNTAEDVETKYDMIRIRRVIPEREDLIESYNDVLKSKLNESSALTSTQRFLIYTTHASSNTEAKEYFNSMQGDIETSFFQMLNSKLEVATSEEWLLLLSQIVRQNKTNPYFILNDDDELTIDAEALKRQGLTIKDIISPSYYKIKPGYLEIDESYSKSFYLKELPNFLTSGFMQDIMSMHCEYSMSIHYCQVPADKANKMVSNKIGLLDSEIITKEQQAANKGRGTSSVGSSLNKELQRLESLQSDLMDRDQKMFTFSIVVTIFAKSEEELKAQSQALTTLSNKYLCTMPTLTYLQESGFNASLPIAQKPVTKQRYMTTESLRVFIPFSEAELFDNGGFYYGINQISKGIIVYNRLKGQNYNGLILGSSGAGKSFLTKNTIISTLLNRPDDYVYVIDPDGEYGPIATKFDGAIIKVAPGNGKYINPLDLDIDNSQDKVDPIVAKSDAIASMVSIMIGAHQSLTPAQKSILDRCVTQIYQPYLEHLMQLAPDPVTGRKRTIDRASCPTLQNLFDTLLQQPQLEAQNLALIMESYATGNFDTFAHKTNVDVSNKFTVYDISEVGSNLKNLALQVCINDIWNNIVANRAKGLWTWFFIDEFHLLLSSDTCSEYLKTIWKRARKWRGVPTGITQNMEELLSSPASRVIINNSEFKVLLNQSQMDIQILKDILHITDEEAKYINNAEQGSGLLCLGSRVVPFKNRYPHNKIYDLINTTENEVGVINTKRK